MRRIVLLWLVSGAAALAETHAIVNARIVPVTSAPIEKGTVVLRDGRIAAVGAKVAVPKEAKKIEAAGLSVYPGMVDAYTTLGLAEIPSVRGSMDTTEIGAFNPQAHAWIAVNPHSEMIRTARVNGITTALVAPSGGRIAGSAAAINLFGNYPNEMLLRPQVGVVMNIPSSRQRGGRSMLELLVPGTPEGGEARGERTAEELAKLKEYLREAKAYSDMKARLEKSGGSLGAARDAGLEAMVPVIRGERVVIVPADHWRDIKAAVELAQEFGLRIVIAGGADAWKIAPYLKEKNVPVLYGAVHSLPRLPEDPYDAYYAAPEVLRRAGVRFALVTGGGGQGGGAAADVRNLPYKAAMAAAYGLEKEDALKAVTLWPAELMGVADKVGSIEAGKLANLLVIRGDPLDVRSEVKYVFVEGKLVPLESRNTEMFERFGQ